MLRCIPLVTTLRSVSGCSSSIVLGCLCLRVGIIAIFVVCWYAPGVSRTCYHQSAKNQDLYRARGSIVLDYPRAENVAGELCVVRGSSAHQTHSVNLIINRIRRWLSDDIFYLPRDRIGYGIMARMGIDPNFHWNVRFPLELSPSRYMFLANLQMVLEVAAMCGWKTHIALRIPASSQHSLPYSSRPLLFSMPVVVLVAGCRYD